MTSRATYIALTPEAEDFPTPRFPTTFIPAPQASESPGLNTRWQEIVSQAFGLFTSNAGLLLVAASQFFFSLMNLAVKKLNSIEPPVPALEVYFHHHQD
jgi:hypothetical protein